MHCKKHGCPKCSGNAPYTNEEYIKKASKRHNNRYDYSKLNYIREHIPVTIICPIHGEFTQKPYSHLNGRGCPKCFGSPRKTTSQFIQECNIVHNFKYDYSLCEYTTAHNKVKIICPIHGEFMIKAAYHVLGGRCPECAKRENKFEEDVLNFIKTFYSGEIIRCDRKTLYDKSTKKCKEIDIFLPDLSIGIECDGEYWHELHEKRVPNYHKRKQKLFDLYGIHQHNIKFYDWFNNKEIEKEKLKNIINNNDNEKIYKN